MFGKKEMLILNHYKQILEGQSFDEFDLIGFFIFIRSFIDKGSYPNIYEICDTVAHRARNQGKANTGIKNIIQNQYRTKNGSKELQGANGISEQAWKDEWIQFGNANSIRITDSIVRDISLCVLSLLQNVQMQDNQSNVIAVLKIVKSQDALSVAVTEGHDGSLFVVFFIVRVLTEPIPDQIIDDAVYTVRTNGKLRLLTENQMLIV